MFYPFEHVGVGSEKLHQFFAGAQPYFFLAQVHKLIVVNSAAHIEVNLGKLFNLSRLAMAYCLSIVE